MHRLPCLRGRDTLLVYCFGLEVEDVAPLEGNAVRRSTGGPGQQRHGQVHVTLNVPVLLMATGWNRHNEPVLHGKDLHAHFKHEVHTKLDAMPQEQIYGARHIEASAPAPTCDAYPRIVCPFQSQHRLPPGRGEEPNPTWDQWKADRVLASSDLVFSPLRQAGDVHERLNDEPLNSPAVLAVKHVPQPTIVDVATKHTVGGLVGSRILGRWHLRLGYALRMSVYCPEAPLPKSMA